MVRGNVVDQPVRDLAKLLDRADAGFLVQLALGRFPCILAGIDAALRHLPDMGFVDMLDAAGAASDEDQPVWVDQHHADAGSVGQVFVSRHSVKASCRRRLSASKCRAAGADLQLDFDFSIAVVNGTSMMPWLSSVLTQSAMRSMEIGSAEAMPTAMPRSLRHLFEFGQRAVDFAAVGRRRDRSALANGRPGCRSEAGEAARRRTVVE